jgi:hypothetical protein
VDLDLLAAALRRTLGVVFSLAARSAGVDRAAIMESTTRLQIPRLLQPEWIRVAHG